MFLKKDRDREKDKIGFQNISNIKKTPARVSIAYLIISIAWFLATFPAVIRIKEKSEGETLIAVIWLVIYIAVVAAILYAIVKSQMSTFFKSQQTLRHMAYYDMMTDLPNRQLFMDRLRIALHHGARTGKKVAVAFFDIDNFKKINDEMGHFAGDELIKAISERVRKAIRKNETVARYSGDEFAVVLQGISDKSEVMSFVNRFFYVFDEPFIVGGKVIHASISMGISIFPDDGQTSLELLQRADEAMYRAKRKGKNTFCFYRMNGGKDMTNDENTFTHNSHDSCDDSRCDGDGLMRTADEDE